MKRILSVMLALSITIFCVVMTGCKNSETTDGGNENVSETLKLGLGVYSEYGKTADADGELNGSASAATTAAAVLVDKDGKIVKSVIDTADCKIEFTSEGATVAANEYKTKGELGPDYGMVAYGGAQKEWNEQAAEFCKLTEGKTLDEVKALIVDGYKGNDEVIAAGCTIGIAEFVNAVEKAYNNAENSLATKDDELVISFVSKQEKAKDATDESDGSCEVANYICAVALDDGGKVAAIDTDSVVAKFSYSNAGSFTTDVTNTLVSKREAGTGYGMAAYGTDTNGDGVVKEWFEQADVLEEACIGKTVSEISALAVDGYGNDELKAAGCTIAISEMVSAVVKAAE